MQSLTEKAIPKLLIYIPCHVDYRMAIHTAEELIFQHGNIPSPKLDIELIISINGVENPEIEIQSNKIKVFSYTEIIGGDTNISKGFIHALEIEPDYFWILSANENLVSDSVMNIANLIEQNRNSDLLIANAENRSGNIAIKNVFTNTPRNLALGLISGVIYNFRKTKESFNQAGLFSWTGWGHLAVINHHLTTSSNPMATEFPDSDVYSKPITFATEVNSGEREIVRNLYGHSFFGLPLLATCLLANQPQTLKYFERRWLLNNWYKVSIFSDQVKFGDEIVLKRLVWIKNLHKSSFGSTFAIRTIFLLCQHLPTLKFQNSSWAQSALNRYKQKL